jgi:hypothetical protein
LKDLLELQKVRFQDLQVHDRRMKDAKWAELSDLNTAEVDEHQQLRSLQFLSTVFL